MCNVTFGCPFINYLSFYFLLFIDATKMTKFETIIWTIPPILIVIIIINIFRISKKDIMYLKEEKRVNIMIIPLLETAIYVFVTIDAKGIYVINDKVNVVILLVLIGVEVFFELRLFRGLKVEKNTKKRNKIVIEKKIKSLKCSGKEKNVIFCCVFINYLSFYILLFLDGNKMSIYETILWIVTQIGIFILILNIFKFNKKDDMYLKEKKRLEMMIIPLLEIAIFVFVSIDAKGRYVINNKVNIVIYLVLIVIETIFQFKIFKILKEEKNYEKMEYNDNWKKLEPLKCSKLDYEENIKEMLHVLVICYFPFYLLLIFEIDNLKTLYAIVAGGCLIFTLLLIKQFKMIGEFNDENYKKKLKINQLILFPFEYLLMIGTLILIQFNIEMRALYILLGVVALIIMYHIMLLVPISKRNIRMKKYIDIMNKN